MNQDPAVSGHRRGRRPLLAYFGHHKAASSWLSRITGDVSGALGLRHWSVNNPSQFGGDLEGFVARHRIDVLSYLNADPDHVAGLENVRAFHVVRDPRDMCVSAYFSHLGSHAVTADWPELVVLRERLRSMSKTDGLAFQIEEMAWVMSQMASWDYDREDILELRMEDVVAEPLASFVTITRFLGVLGPDAGSRVTPAATRRVATILARHVRLPRPAPRLSMATLTAIIERNDFSRLAGGRRSGEEDTTSHYRKGVAGDWRNHFEPRHVEAFEAMYGSVVSALGYR